MAFRCFVTLFFSLAAILNLEVYSLVHSQSSVSFKHRDVAYFTTRLQSVKENEIPPKYPIEARRKEQVGELTENALRRKIDSDAAAKELERKQESLQAMFNMLNSVPKKLT